MHLVGRRNTLDLSEALDEYVVALLLLLSWLVLESWYHSEVALSGFSKAPGFSLWAHWEWPLRFISQDYFPVCPFCF